MSAAPDQEKDNGLNWKVIRETLDELIDFSKPKADNDVVDKFIARIIPQGNNSANFPGSVILNRVFGFTKLGFPYKINVFRTFLLKMCGFFAILIE